MEMTIRRHGHRLEQGWLSFSVESDSNSTGLCGAIECLLREGHSHCHTEQTEGAQYTNVCGCVPTEQYL